MLRALSARERMLGTGVRAAAAASLLDDCPLAVTHLGKSLWSHCPSPRRHLALLPTQGAHVVDKCKVLHVR